jgi:pimeloyl-ACP methyl ester carboxylesterase
MKRGALCGLLPVLLLITGCETIQLALGFKKQVAKAAAYATIEGSIDTEAPAEGPLVVVVGETIDESLRGVDSFVRSRPGAFVFQVPAGRYQLGAYEDRNRNGLLDPGERTRDVRNGPVLEVGPGERAREDILLARDATSPPELTEPMDVLGVVARTPREQLGFSLWAFSAQGEICEDLMDPRFGRKAGTRGLWQVMDFLTDGLAGIYFLEPYDPERVPVLFVHGIGGNPQEFAPLMESLDASRFQPWFYFYPSGFELTNLANHLAGLLERLHVRHDFDELAVIAHSMGGLVSRAMILKWAEESGRDDVRLFVSISTPWGGQPQAERAADAPLELPPVFQNMSPSSDFLRLLFLDDGDPPSPRPLPPATEFHMIFGFRMAGSSRTADDGIATVASQARYEAQEQATSVRALDLGHVDILESTITLERVNRLLRARFP